MSSLRVAYKQYHATEIKESHFDDMQKLCLDSEVMLHCNGKSHIGVKFGCCCLFYGGIRRNNFNSESELLTDVV